MNACKHLSLIPISLIILSLFFPLVYAATFGDTTEGEIAGNIENIVRGSVFTITQAGTADSITAYIQNTLANKKMRCAIYYHINLSKVMNGETQELTVTFPFWNWKTFNFNAPKPSLTASTAYVLVVWSQAAGGVAYVYGENGAINQGHCDYSETYSSVAFPNPLVPIHESYQWNIYCTYTPSEVGVTYKTHHSFGVNIVTSHYKRGEYNRYSLITETIGVSQIKRGIYSRFSDIDINFLFGQQREALFRRYSAILFIVDIVQTIPSLITEASFLIYLILFLACLIGFTVALVYRKAS